MHSRLVCKDPQTQKDFETQKTIETAKPKYVYMYANIRTALFDQKSQTDIAT